jgi:hypothetical protein
MPILGSNSSGGSRPSAPVIGSATDGGTGTTASVAFTPSTYIGKGTITYTATSSPGSITATSSSSPITVSGLTTGTAYTFTVQGSTNYGVTSAVSSSSNSLTLVAPTSFESIATYTGNGGSSVATFSSIPQTYKSLQIRISALGGESQCITKFNGLTASYRQHFLYGTGSAAGATATTGDYFYSFWNINGMDGTYPLVQIIDVIDYASTAKYKTFRSFAGSNRNDTSNGEIMMWSGSNFANTNAITSINVENTGSNFATGTTIAVYGVK